MVTPLPSLCAISYIAIAVIVSLYQAYRGFMFQRILGVQQIQGATRRVILLCLADMLTYLVCTLSGFIALLLLFHSGVAEARLPTSAGEATWLIFLTLYSLLGVTGKLPKVLTRLKLPSAEDH